MKKTRTHLPHIVIVKAPGLLPMLYTVTELAQELRTPERTLRDWLASGAPHIRDNGTRIWISGQEFAAWVAHQRKPKKERTATSTQGYCLRCNKLIEIVDPVIVPIQGKLINVRGTCPDCNGIVNRGDRIPNSPIRNTIPTGA